MSTGTLCCGEGDVPGVPWVSIETSGKGDASNRRHMVSGGSPGSMVSS